MKKLINDYSPRVVWNTIVDRPATSGELAELVHDHIIFIDYYAKTNNGLVWVALDSRVKVFELRMS